MAKKLGLNVSFGLNTKDFSTKMQNVKRSMRNAGKQFSAVASTLAPIGLALGAVAAGAVRAAADMEVMNQRLITAFQGNEGAAKKALSEITKFTAETPFQLEEVADGFVRLKNMGLDPSIDSLRSYGNTAAAMGKSLNQMIEAVADAATGEFERLKEFGIKANKQGDRVKFTFRGVAKEVGFNSEEIQQYLLNIGNTEFAGGIEKQAQTLVGQLSTLRDTFKLLAAQLGEILLPAIKRIVSGMQTLAGKIQKLIDFRNIFGQGEDNEITRMRREIVDLEEDLDRWGRRGTKAGDAIIARIAELNEKIKETQSSAKRFSWVKTLFGKGAGNNGDSSGGEVSDFQKAVNEEIEKQREAARAIKVRQAAARTKRRGGKIGELSGVGMSGDFGGGLGEFSAPIVEEVGYISEAFDDLGASVDRTIEQMNSLLNSFASDTLVFFGNKLGEALSGGGFKNGELGKGLLEMTGGFMQQLGALMITTGISLEAFTKGLASMNPALVVGAGVALVAAGAAVANFARQGVGSQVTGGASTTGFSGAYGAGQNVNVTGVVRGADLHLMYGDQNRRRR